MNLERVNILEPQPVRRPAEMTAELRDRMDVGSLRRRREIADRHVLDHAAAQRAHLGHLGLSCPEKGGCDGHILSDRGLQPAILAAHAASAASFNPPGTEIVTTA